ncbi:hypothetical protein OKW21_004281 [Catalinimonas alkaloidigena]|nr:hypothetical protein [Catalinimonas alkaloidigena]
MELLETALKSTTANLGNQHPNVAITLSNLGTVYKAMGLYAKAREVWVQAYDIFCQVVGEDHFQTKHVKTFLQQIEGK